MQRHPIRSAKTGKWNDDGIKIKEKPIGKPPKSRVCFICGKLFLLHSFPIHEAACRKLYIDREALKPLKDRKPCPEDPAILMMKAVRFQEGMSNSFEIDASIGRSSNILKEKTGKRVVTLEDVNAASQATYSAATLSQCRWCERTMLPEKLPKHNRFCTKDRPARRVGESVRVAATAGSVVEPKKMRRREIEPSSGITLTSWRSKSNAFRAAIANARRVSRAEQLSKETGLPISNFLVPPSEEEQWLLTQASGGNVLTQCANCGRSFNVKAAERHIPICASIVNKPRRLMRGTGVTLKSEGSSIVIQKPVWNTNDSGVIVESFRRLPQDHLLSTHSARIAGPNPYGLSKRPALTKESPQPTYNSSAPKVVQSREVTEFPRSTRSAGAINDARHGSARMATAHGDILQKLMKTKQSVTTMRLGDGKRVR